MKYKYILLDLDGTIAETAEGIRNSFEKTLKALGADMIDLSDYTKYIGPPLLDTLKNLCKLPPELCEKGYSIYKDFYWNEGRFMIKPYEGIELVLKELRKKKQIKQDDFLDVHGISRSTIAMVETGKTDITLSKLKIIADVLGVNLKELLDFE